MAKGDPLTSPLGFSFGDYLWDPAGAPDQHVIRITLGFNETTHALTGATVYRSPDCRWTKIVIGLGTDGIPDSSTFVFDLAGFSGTRNVTANQMARPPYNCATVEDFLSAGQITAAL